MMTPKEKAEELYNKYAPYMIEWDGVDKWAAKECSLIAVDEQIELLLNLSQYMAFPEHVKHLQEIKKEIENL
jgi:hypothetical protein